MHCIVGYGSLLNKMSAERTVAFGKESRPVRVYGWRRIFNFVCGEDKEVKSMDKAVLNVVPDKAIFFNGVLFEVDDAGLERIKQRECDYDMAEVDVHCFHTNEKLGKATLFVGKRENIMYFVHPDSEYYRLCMTGAASFGEEFLKEWNETTFHASGKRVCEMVLK